MSDARILAACQAKDSQGAQGVHRLADSRQGHVACVGWPGGGGHRFAGDAASVDWAGPAGYLVGGVHASDGQSQHIVESSVTLAKVYPQPTNQRRPSKAGTWHG